MILLFKRSVKSEISSILISESFKPENNSRIISPFSPNLTVDFSYKIIWVIIFCFSNQLKMKKILLKFFIIFIVPVFLLAQSADTTKISSSDSKLANKLYNESLELFDEGKSIEAITLINKAITLNPRVC